MAAVHIDESTWVLVLTGAGVSAESGIPTFRDANGLWENHVIEEVASPQGFARDPSLVWRFYSERRRGVLSCTPNPSHTALVDLERRLGDRFLLVTQNVDGLHVRAGSQRLIPIHGTLCESKCSGCDRAPFVDTALYLDTVLPECDRCAERGQRSLLRPNIVWFGEVLDSLALSRIESFVETAAAERLVFVAAGTSGLVYPAAGLVNVARRAGAETWLVNADRAANASSFDHFVEGASGTILPSLFS